METENMDVETPTNTPTEEKAVENPKDEVDDKPVPAKVDDSEAYEKVAGKKRKLSEEDKEVLEPPPKSTKTVERSSATNLRARACTDLTALRNQIEYYFSNSNLPFDKFMIDEMRKNDGWLKLEILLTFNRVSKHTNIIEPIRSAIVVSKSLELNDDKTAVRRCEAAMGVIPTKQEIFQRSIFAKGFHPRATRDELETYFKEKFGSDSVLSLRLIRTRVEILPSKKAKNDTKDSSINIRRFRGDCYVELPTVELVDKWSNVTMQYKNRRIIVGKSKDYQSTHHFKVDNTETIAFESDRTLYLSNIPSYATDFDIKHWLTAPQLRPSRPDFVWKQMGAGECYVRLKAESAAALVNKIQKLRKTLMGSVLNAVSLNDESAAKVWPHIARLQIGAKVTPVAAEKPDTDTPRVTATATPIAAVQKDAATNPSPVVTVAE